MPTKYKAAGN